MSDTLYFVYWKELGTGDTEVRRSKFGFSLPVAQQIASEMNQLHSSTLIHWVADIDGHTPKADDRPKESSA